VVNEVLLVVDKDNEVEVIVVDVVIAVVDTIVIDVVTEAVDVIVVVISSVGVR
jgi:hypothetical protein